MAGLHGKHGPLGKNALLFLGGGSVKERQTCIIVSSELQPEALDDILENSRKGVKSASLQKTFHLQISDFLFALKEQY